MNFHAPQLLWLLLVPLVFVLADLTRRVRAAASRPKILRARAGSRSLVLARGPAPVSPEAKFRLRLWLGLALAVVALARPQWGRVSEPVFDQSREILIALDLSRSMLAPDIRPSRLERAKLLVSSLLGRLRGERVGLIVFAGTAFLQSPLSADYEILREFLPQLNPAYLPQGGSDYEALLKAAIGAFGEQPGGADRYLIILSDGEATDDAWKPLAAGLVEKNIRVIGLGVGTEAGSMIPDGAGGFVKDGRGAVVLSRLESGTLRDLADATTGVYADASSWVDLAQIIEATVATGRKGEFREENRVRMTERYQWFLAAALVFLAWSLWGEFPVRPRPRAMRLAGGATGATGAANTAAGATTGAATAAAAAPYGVRRVLAAFDGGIYS
ncbi:MAG: VWA domain-containing protein, partial [Opitutaceae bacterium]|nr:VWA domain-containing protein [Opitutaceae bacterium]